MKWRDVSLCMAAVFGAAAHLWAAPLGDVTGVVRDGQNITVQCGGPAVRFEVWDDSVVRIWLSSDGRFSYYNSTNAYMIQPGLMQFKKGPRTLRVDDAADRVVIRTADLSVCIGKKPFGLQFLKSDGTTVLASTVPGQSLDTDVKACFKRDACGRPEHFFGLQYQGGVATTLDRRGETVGLEDRNGDGWAVPFIMSTAGYALFFHNEDSKNTRFAMTDPFVIENTAKQGRLDLFFIYGPDCRRMIDLYTGITGKPPMPPKKLLGFQYLVQGTPITTEEAFPEWVKRGYPIDSCITFTDQRVETAGEIAAVASTGRRIHALNGLFGFYYDVCSPGTFKDSKPEPRVPPYADWAGFKALVKSRLLDNGVDWFWIDETDDGWSPRFQFNLYQAVTEITQAQDSRRGFLCARGGSAGCQRFGYPWMGDLPYRRATVLANLCNGLVGVAHSTHDMAGAELHGQSDATFLAGVKANFLNPISQCNAWIPKQIPCHRPWEWSEQVQSVFRKFLDLHYRLIPYFYTMAWQAHTTGAPDWRALLLDYPNDQETYASDEILVGDWLLMAPLYDHASRTVYLPEGKWHYFFNGKVFNGPCKLASFQPPVDEYPIFVKAGAIIPLMPTMRYMDEKPMDPLTLLIYPAGTSSTTLYEDDGKTRNYQAGEYCTTKIDCAQSDSAVRVTVNARTGRFNPGARTLVLDIYSPANPAAVRLDGHALKPFKTLEQLAAATQGWGYFADELTGCFMVRVKVPDAGRTVALDILRDPAAPLAPTSAGHAVFTATDEKTGQAWKGVYGAGGHWLSGGDVMLPRNTRVTAAASRISVTVPGPGPKPVCLYLPCAPQQGTAVTVKAVDPGTGQIFDVRTVAAREKGTYLLYEVSGSADFLFSASAGDIGKGVGVFINQEPNPLDDFDAKAALVFKGEDRATQGNWIGVYGGSGQSLAGAGSYLPGGVFVRMGGTPCTWADKSTAPNALQKPGGAERIAACHYGSDLDVDVGVKGDRPKKIALYFLDWDGKGARSIQVTALNPRTDEVYDTRRLDAFDGGVYLRYEVMGHVRFSVVRTGGANAVVSAVAVDE